MQDKLRKPIRYGIALWLLWRLFVESKEVFADGNADEAERKRLNGLYWSIVDHLVYPRRSV
jgi:hypothetical protein